MRAQLKLSKKQQRKLKRKEAKKEKQSFASKTPRSKPSDSFLESYEWRCLRMKILKRDGRKCACCGATPLDGAVMNVDHIKPRKLFPALAMDEKNLQVLCHECNHGKSNWDMTNWKEMNEKEIQHLRDILKEA